MLWQNLRHEYCRWLGWLLPSICIAGVDKHVCVSGVRLRGYGALESRRKNIRLLGWLSNDISDDYERCTTVTSVRCIKSITLTTAISIVCQTILPGFVLFSF